MPSILLLRFAATHRQHLGLYVAADRLYGHIRKRGRRVELLEFCRYIAWRNRNTDTPRLRTLVSTANVARCSARSSG